MPWFVGRTGHEFPSEIPWFSAEDRGFGGYEDGLAVGPQFQISWKAEKEARAGGRDDQQFFYHG